MRIEKYIEMLQEMQKEHPCVDVFVRRDGYVSEPILAYNVKNVGVGTPREYIQVL